MERVVVTGANGFMGSRIVRVLVERGHRVIALVGDDRDAHSLEGLDVELRRLDLTDPEGVLGALEGGQLLVHNAAVYSFWERDPTLIYRVNVGGTRNVMEAAAHHGYRRFVYTSSASTLTPALEGEPGTEQAVFDLRRFGGHYKSSKVIAEMAVLRAMARGLTGVIVHPTTVVGAGDVRPTPTGGMIVHFLNRRMKAYVNTVLNVVGVDDVAEGHALALERGRPGRQYILGGENVSMRDVTRILSEATGIRAPRIVIPSRVLLGVGRANEFLANRITRRTPLVDVESTLHALVNRAFYSDLAQKQLGYRPSRARVALAEAVDWFVEHGYCPDEVRRRIGLHRERSAAAGETRGPADGGEPAPLGPGSHGASRRSPPPRP